MVACGCFQCPNVLSRTLSPRFEMDTGKGEKRQMTPDSKVGGVLMKSPRGLFSSAMSFEAFATVDGHIGTDG